MKNKKKGSGGLFSKSQQPQQPQQFNFPILQLPVDIRRKIVKEPDIERLIFLNKTLLKNDKEIDKILKKIDKNEINLEKQMALKNRRYLQQQYYQQQPTISQQQQNDMYIELYRSTIKKLEKKYFELEDEYKKDKRERDFIQTKTRIRAELLPWREKPPSSVISDYSTRSRTKNSYYNTRSQSKKSQSRSTQIKKTIKKK